MLVTLGTVVMRPCSPRLSSRKPSRISRPMFRFGLGIVHFLSNLPEDVGRDVFRHILRIHREHPDHPLCHAREIDDAVATPLAPAAGAPPKLPHATRPSDHVSGFGICD